MYLLFLVCYFGYSTARLKQSALIPFSFQVCQESLIIHGFFEKSTCLEMRTLALALGTSVIVPNANALEYHLNVFPLRWYVGLEYLWWYANSFVHSLQKIIVF